jgi:LmbE family N-acetylglucosaminyl deacetylase
MTRTILHFSPHPDDELIGAPATLMALRDAGYRILNVACGLGRPDQQRQRRSELQEASRRAGFETLIPERPPIESSRSDDATAVFADLADLAKATIEEHSPEIVLSPSPHDRHPSHELLARAVRDVLPRTGTPTPRWWMWAIWGPLPAPTLGTPFGQARLGEILAALGAYEGELVRNNYRRLVAGRAEMQASLGQELLFGFGTATNDERLYAELLTETVLLDGRWLLGSARWLKASDPLAPPTQAEIGEWLFADSVTDKLGAPGEQPRMELYA